MTMFAGKDEVNTFVLITLKSAIKMRLAGMQVNRAYTIKNMLAKTTGFTGNIYPRSDVGLRQAFDDLQAKYDAIVKAREEEGAR